jgi:PmbA protein
VVFHPDFAEDMVDAYVIGNLRGSSVATGRSAFAREAFGDSEPVFREDFHFEVDPTVPFSSGSYRMTGEGLPARRTVYVSRGRLLRPIVGLKDARRLGMEPTTPPRGMESVVYGGRSARSFRRVLEGLERGALVMSALGLHTQDTASGNYSLTAPQALTIRGGRLVGHAKLTLSGNAFEQLRSPELGFVTFPGYRRPGLLVMAHVSVEG